MKIANLCILVPIYKEVLSDDESKALALLKRNAGEEDVFFVAPEKLDIRNYQQWQWPFAFFPEKFFLSVDGYTRLLLSQFFYERFVDYEYMLICQTDALLLQPSSKVADYLTMGYDYFGAPWPEGQTVYCYTFKGLSRVSKWFRPRTCYVGNGGFSLRNISKTIALLKEKRKYTRIWNMGEDCFFSYHGMENRCGYRVAPMELAYDFALEEDAGEQIAKGRLPLGIHGWKKFYPDFFDEKLLGRTGSKQKEL